MMNLANFVGGALATLGLLEIIGRSLLRQFNTFRSQQPMTRA